MCHGTFVSAKHTISAEFVLSDSALGRYSRPPSWYTLIPFGFWNTIRKSPGYLGHKLSINVLFISCIISVSRLFTFTEFMLVSKSWDAAELVSFRLGAGRGV